MSDQQKEWDGPDVPGQKGSKTFWLYAVLLGICGFATMLGFCALMNPTSTANGMQKELAAIHSFDIGASAEAQHAINKRADFWGKIASYVVPSVAEEETPGIWSVVDDWSISATGLTLQAWWNKRMKVNVANFFPVVFLRLEMVIMTFLLFMSTWPIAYYLGQRYARLSKREGKAVGDNRFQWVLKAVRISIFGVWVLPFCPMMPPVAYWLVPAYLLCWCGLAWLRRNSIEL